MNAESIILELKSERERIDKAIAALEALDTRPQPDSLVTGIAAPKKNGRRHMSPAARKRMSEMMKKRWAERKKKARRA